MTYQRELSLLRERGYALGPVDARTGCVRIWDPAGQDAVDVRLGEELDEFAAGQLTFSEIRERREDEVLSEEP
jgi:hypothetical protein